MSLLDQIDQIRSTFMEELYSISSSKDVERMRIHYFGKKGTIASLMRFLRDATPEDRPNLGKIINDTKEELSSHLENTQKRLLIQERQHRFAKEAIDVTLPAEPFRLGIEHPVQKVLQEVVAIFSSFGFSVGLAPDLDTEHYNFTGLNFAEDHPAKDMQDTFYFPKDYLLRTHTSNVQVHLMENQKPPMKIIAPGKCFRNETVSSRSHVFFHQIEGFYIDQNVCFTELLELMRAFWPKLFGTKVKVRFRPSYFPFVEPGLEVDIACTQCQSQGCKLCKYTGWLEVAGAGMIHPNVLDQAKIDSEVYQGYAFGIGVERIAMLLYGIEDIRTFSRNDPRVFEQVALKYSSVL